MKKVIATIRVEWVKPEEARISIYNPANKKRDYKTLLVDNVFATLVTGPWGEEAALTVALVDVGKGVRGLMACLSVWGTHRIDYLAPGEELRVISHQTLTTEQVVE